MSIFTRSTTAALAAGLQKEQAASDPSEIKEAEWLQHQAEIEALIQHFNLGVQNSFAEGSVNGLAPRCTPQGFIRMQKKHSGWRERAIKELNLTACEFLSFTLEPPTAGANNNGLAATAYTFEKWVFVFENGEQKATKGSVDRYILQFLEGNWKVDSVMTYAAEE
jgi:hypothetical protein